jgi:enoyl-CoA hydratase/carnithine racemase
MADSLTLLEKDEGVALLTLNRPDKRNALSRALRQEIVQRLDGFERDEAVRAVILERCLRSRSTTTGGCTRSPSP